MENFASLKIIDGIVIPQANKKREFIEECKQKYNDQLFLLYDKDGIIICD